MKRILAGLFSVLAFCLTAQDVALRNTKTVSVGATVSLPLKEKGSFTFDSELKKGSELVFRFRLGIRGRLDMSVGESRFTWSASGSECIRAQFQRSKKSRAETQDIFTRGVLKKSLAWNDSLAAWCSFRRYSVPDLAELDLSARIVSDGENYNVWLNGYFLTTVSAGSVAIKFEDAEILSSSESVNPDISRFVTLDLSSKYNSFVRFKRGSYPENSIWTANGVPFFFAYEVKRGNVLDLSSAWAPFASIRSEGDEFGARWGGIWRHDAASQNSPWRFRFRVPAGDYKALHVVAATDKPIQEALDTFTVQFYRAGAGFPKEFKSPRVPLMNSKAVGGRLVVDGRSIFVVTVPIDPGILKEFADREYMEFELTKDVLDYQCYPDPFFYSRHGGGLPSGVKIFAATLEKSDISVDFKPSSTANVFLAPDDKIMYTAEVSNKSDSEKKLDLVVTSESWDKSEKTSSGVKHIKLAPNETKTVEFELDNIEKYGHHNIELVVSGDSNYSQKRTLSYLHPRKNTNPSFDFEGFMFGFWNWRGSHYTLDGAPLFEVMGKAGFKATGFNIPAPEFDRNPAFDMASQYHFRTYFAGDLWPTADYTQKMAEKQKQSNKEWSDYLRRANLRADTAPIPNPLIEKKFFAFGTEPSFGIWTMGSLPQYYGEPELDPYSDANPPVAGVKLNADHGSAYKRMAEGMKKSVPLLKKDIPGVNVMAPWGDPNFVIPFLRDSELAESIDGVLYDSGQFDRMPEMQLHQTVIHRMWQFRNEWKKYSKKTPVISTIEGPCYSGVLPGALTENEAAAYSTRSMLLLGAYGANKQFSVMGGSAPGDYWGEQHYGAGTIGRLPLLNPHVSFSAVATLVRHMENTRFVRSVPFRMVKCQAFDAVGINDSCIVESDAPGVYCVEHEILGSKSEKVYFMWVVRGRRNVTFDTGKVKAFDIMDNEMDLDDNTLTLSEMPVIVYGLSDIEKHVTFDVPVHPDSVNGEHASRIASFGDGKWKQVHREDRDYTEAAPDFIRRFPAEMKLENITAMGGITTCLSITLPKQAKNRGTMPHYTTLVPERSIVIHGAADTLNIEAFGVGDWGRVVLVLRDAKGEKWISCGVKNEWNCDDTKSLSSLNFEGWRLIKIPLPGNAPYDSFRLSGTASYAAYNGDERVDYPLSLENVIVERREQFIQVDSLESVAPKAIALGDVYAEYSSADKMTRDYEKLANMRMPLPKGVVVEPNPIKELAEKGTLEAVTVTRMEEPATYNDGTNGILHFTLAENADAYDVYVSASASGEGALLLAKNVKTTPVHMRGWKAEKDFYAFVVYRTKDRKSSKPSAPFKFNMKKNFGNL